MKTQDPIHKLLSVAQASEGRVALPFGTSLFWGKVVFLNDEVVTIEDTRGLGRREGVGHMSEATFRIKDITQIASVEEK